MASNQYYRLSTFRKLGRNNFAREFTIVDDEDLYTFQWKNYYDEDGDIRCVKMLRVGRYHYKAGGPPAWAYADGVCIQYFSGRESVVEVIRKEQESRVYFTKPLAFLAGPQNAHGMTPGRMFGKASAEAVILFLFLRFGGTKTVYADPEALRHFEVACRNFESNRKVYENLKTLKASQSYDSDDEVKEGCSSDDDTSFGPKDVTLSARRHSEPFNSATVTSIEEDTKLKDEIQDLKAGLRFLRHRADNTNISLKEERKRRRVAEKDVKTAQDSLAQQIWLADELAELGTEREGEISELQVKLDECKEDLQQSQIKVAKLQNESANQQAKSRRWQRQSEEYKTKSLKWRDESQHWHEKYEGLKRKLKGLTEDDGGRCKKVLKR